MSKMETSQIALPLTISMRDQLFNNDMRLKRDLSIEERKKYCKGIEYAGIVTETIGDVVGDISDYKEAKEGKKPSNDVKPTTPVTACLSLVSHVTKGGMDIASAALECDDIPFDEIKQILNDRFNEIDRKLDANTEAMEKVTDMVTKTFNSVEKMRRDMKGGFNEVLEKIEGQEIKTILNSINTIIRHFENEIKEIKGLPKDQYLNKLQKQTGILDFLQKMRLPTNDSLHSLLFKLIDKNNNFAIPKRADDTIAFQALYALFYGTQTYASIMFFLLEHHSYLADYYYQNRELEKFNEEFTTVENIFDEFKSSLIGTDEDQPLFKEVSDIFTEIKEKSFITDVENDLFQDLVKKEESIMSTKNKIEEMKLPIIREIPLKADNVDFVNPVMKTPYGEWRKGSDVKYAIQFVEDGKYSKLGPWSKAFSVKGQANPTLTFAVDEQRRDRLIFRKIDDSTPELVGILKFPNVEFKDINRDLFDACGSIHKKQALREVRKLFNIKADINVVFDLERNALHAAAESGNSDVADFLIRKGLDVNVKDIKDFTPLHVAAAANRHDIILLLIQKGANLNAHSNTDQTTPLHVAARRGFLQTVEALMTSEALNPNEKEISEYTALHHAVYGGSLIVEALLSSEKTDVNAKSTVGLTPFHLAVINDDREVANSLLKSGKVDVNAVNVNGLTALHFVSMTENLEMIELLLKLDGININAQATDIKWTPLHFAIYSKQQKAALKLLENSKIDINLTAKGEITALHLSVATGQLNISRELLNKNPDIEARTEEGYTPLHLSAMHLDPDTVALLLKKGANIEAKFNDGSTALHLAVKSGRLETATKLLKNKANVNAQNKDGSTPLHLAVSLKQKDLVSKLLSTGADTSIKDSKNLIPLYIAIENNDLDISKIFVQYQPDIMKSDVHLKFVMQAFERDLYDYLKYPNSEKYKVYNGLENLEVLKKMGKYELVKILSNDPEIEMIQPGTKYNGVEVFLFMVIFLTEECLQAEKENTPGYEMCQNRSRRIRSAKISISHKNDDPFNSIFFQANPSIATSANQLLSPVLSDSNYRNSFSSHQSNSSLNFDGVGALILLNLIIRKFNDEKYIKKTNEMHSDLELQAEALSMTEKIEKLLEKISNVAPVGELIDLSEVHSKVYKALKKGNESDIVNYLCPTLKKFFNSNLPQFAEDYSHEILMILIKKACSIDN